MLVSARAAVRDHLVNLAHDFQFTTGTTIAFEVPSEATRPLELVLEEFCDSTIDEAQKLSTDNFQRARAPRWLADIVVAAVTDALTVLLQDEIRRLQARPTDVARLVNEAQAAANAEAKLYSDAFATHVEPFTRAFDQLKSGVAQAANRARRNWPRRGATDVRTRPVQPHLKGGARVTVFDGALQAVQAAPRFTRFLNSLRDTGMATLSESAMFKPTFRLAQRAALGQDVESICDMVRAGAEVSPGLRSSVCPALSRRHPLAC